ncbi:MAG TPA: hypothetical protein VM802_18880 [Chitinophaga sp.]|uniref:hypothetical protein n=1 Tax=Chitinophaga sp. TaxID=1869181 RepID=UPI002C441DA2|nr:hypothetical protein [Chitinophaga sp.]HVI46952.1 hypothetical protein [Chitinophaga sp.]
MKRYSTILAILFALLAVTRVGKAQQPAGEAAEKIKQLQMDYLAKKLDLSDDEAQKFWPVYKNYTKEVELLIAERQSRKAQDKLSDASADDIAKHNMDRELSYEKRMLDIRSKYTNEFQRVLPARKAGMVFKGEREFRGIMINHLNTQRMNRLNQGILRRRP